MAAMHVQLKRLGESMWKYAERRGYHHEWAMARALKNNNEWWNKRTLLDVLKVMGQAVRIGPMLGRDT